MERISKENYYLDIAETVLERATCLRRIYGAIIVKNDEIISTGYNGAPRGRANCVDMGYCSREAMNVPRGERYELCRSVHAEANAIISASRRDMVGGTIYLVGRNAATGELRSVVEREEMLRELLGILKDVKAALTAPEADLAALLEEQLRRQKTRIDTGRRSGSLSQEAERSHRRIIAALERQKALVGQTVDSQTGFAAVKADFDQMVQGLKAQAKTAGEMLNNLFAFCEEVFPEGQELLILVTELTINYYAATFISRYGCDAYFTHNQELLFYERQQEIISQLESLELN